MLEKIKEFLKRYIGFGFITTLYFIFMVVSLIVIILGIMAANGEEQFLKAGVPTIIALVFGASSKALYQFFVEAPFNFDTEKFEENKLRKKVSRGILFLNDLISGIAVLVYILKISPIPTYIVAIGIVLIFILLSAMIIGSLVWDATENS